MDDNKLYFSKLSDPEKYPDDTSFEEYESCKCGKSLEDVLRIQGLITLVRLDFVGPELRRQILCADCYLLTEKK